MVGLNDEGNAAKAAENTKLLLERDKVIRRSWAAARRRR
jgi:hypothetical protein